MECIEFEDLRDFYKKEVDEETFMIYLEELYNELATSYNTQSKEKGISKNRFTKYLPEMNIFISEKIFSSFNNSNSGLLSFKEFAHPIKTLKYGSFEEVALIIFKIYDFNSDTKINTNDIKQLIAYLPLKSKDDQKGYKYQMESLAEIDQVMKSTFGVEQKDQKIIFDNFLKFLEKKANIFLLLVCFLYLTMPVFEKAMALYKVKKKKMYSGDLPDESILRNRTKSDEMKKALSPPKSVKLNLTPTVFSPVSELYKRKLQNQKAPKSVLLNYRRKLDEGEIKQINSNVKVISSSPLKKRELEHSLLNPTKDKPNFSSHLKEFVSPQKRDKDLSKEKQSPDVKKLVQISDELKNIVKNEAQGQFSSRTEKSQEGLMSSPVVRIVDEENKNETPRNNKDEKNEDPDFQKGEYADLQPINDINEFNEMKQTLSDSKKKIIEKIYKSPKVDINSRTNSNLDEKQEISKKVSYENSFMKSSPKLTSNSSFSSTKKGGDGSPVKLTAKTKLSGFSPLKNQLKESPTDKPCVLKDLSEFATKTNQEGEIDHKCKEENLLLSLASPIKEKKELTNEEILGKYTTPKKNVENAKNSLNKLKSAEKLTSLEQKFTFHDSQTQLNEGIVLEDLPLNTYESINEVNDEYISTEEELNNRCSYR